MPNANARVSVALTAQVRDDGVFPSCQTYPASFERYLTSGAVSVVYAVTGTVGATATTLPVASSLSRVKLWYVENLSTSGSTADVTVAGAPVVGTVPRGQIVLATNDATGWTAAAVTITGTAGTPYKIIALGN